MWAIYGCLTLIGPLHGFHIIILLVSSFLLRQLSTPYTVAAPLTQLQVEQKPEAEELPIFFQERGFILGETSRCLPH